MGNIFECTQYGTCTVEHPSKHSEAVKVSDEDKMEPNYHQWFSTPPGGFCNSFWIFFRWNVD